MMSKKSVYSANISFDKNNNLLLVKFKNGVNIEIDEMNVLIDESLKLVGTTPFLLLVDARDILSDIDHESRHFFVNHDEYNHLNIAQAIVVNNTPIKLLANFYLKFYSHKKPVKVFKSIDEAKKWLYEQV